jgi:hypothetical protein
MNVQVTPAALQEIAVLRRSGYRGAGFLLGTGIGHSVLIERLLPLDFKRKGGDRVFHSVCENYQQQLRGVFFCLKRPFALDWFLHDLVMDIGRDQIRMLTCEFSTTGRQPSLVPLLEQKEDAWRS